MVSAHVGRIGSSPEVASALTLVGCARVAARSLGRRSERRLVCGERRTESELGYVRTARKRALRWTDGLRGGRTGALRRWGASQWRRRRRTKSWVGLGRTIVSQEHLGSFREEVDTDRDTRELRSGVKGWAEVGFG